MLHSRISSRSFMAVAVLTMCGCGDSSRSPAEPDALVMTSVALPAIASTRTETGGEFQSVIPATTPTLTEAAARPLSDSRPYQAVCEAQGGEFNVAIDIRSLYCAKEGALFTAFTENQLHVQRTLCEHMYGAFFGIEGRLPNTTVTFCSTATPG